MQELGLASIGLLTPLRRLYLLPVRQASVLPTASSGFGLANDTLAVQLTLPLAGRVEHFHLQVSAPCQAHQRNAPELEAGLRGVRAESVRLCQEELAGDLHPLLVGDGAGDIVDGHAAVLPQRAKRTRDEPLQPHR